MAKDSSASAMEQQAPPTTCDWRTKVLQRVAEQRNKSDVLHPANLDLEYDTLEGKRDFGLYVEKFSGALAATLSRELLPDTLQIVRGPLASHSRSVLMSALYNREKFRSMSRAKICQRVVSRTWTEMDQRLKEATVKVEETIAQLKLTLIDINNKWVTLGNSAADNLSDLPARPQGHEWKRVLAAIDAAAKNIERVKKVLKMTTEPQAAVELAQNRRTLNLSLSTFKKARHILKDLEDKGVKMVEKWVNEEEEAIKKLAMIEEDEEALEGRPESDDNHASTMVS